MTRELASRDSADIAKVRAALDYDPNTGLFTWREGRRRPHQIATIERPGGYLGIKLGYRIIAAHRLAWFHFYSEWPDQVIDHIDGNPMNNRIQNLRDVSRSVNGQNQRKATAQSQTGLLGCHPHRTKFAAQIKVGGRQRHIGLFHSPEEAHAAYLTAKRRLHEGCTL